MLQIFSIITGCVVVNYLGPTRTRLIQVMSSMAWGLATVLVVSAVFGSVRMYVLIFVACVAITLSVIEMYKHKYSLSKKDYDRRSDSPCSNSEEEMDSFSEDVAESNLPFSSTPSKHTVTQALQPAEEISSPLITVTEPALIPGHNAEVKHTDSVECKDSNDLSTAITTSHHSALLDDSHTIHGTTNNNQKIDTIGSRDQGESRDQGISHDQKASHDETDFINRKGRRTSFRNYQKKRQLISQIFFILILICIVTVFYHNPWVACCLLLPIACMVLIRRIVYIKFVNAHLKWAWLNWKSSSLHSIIFPPLVCRVYNAYTKLDKKVIVFVLQCACMCV